MDAVRHADRIVLVTGAGSGIGQATVARVAAEGAYVVGADISADGLARTAALADKAAQHPLVMIRADVSVQEDVDRLVSEVADRYGRIDAVANVAGIMDWFLPAHEVDDETWSRVMAVNVDGPMRITRAVLPSMMAAGRGAIVNVASEAGLRGAAGGFAYTAAKHAVIGQAKSVAWVYAERGIRCNAVCPGAVETNLRDTAMPRSEWGVDQLRPVLRLRGGSVPPDRVASCISWLLGDEAANVNGAVLAADNGWAAG